MAEGDEAEHAGQSCLSVNQLSRPTYSRHIPVP